VGVLFVTLVSAFIAIAIDTRLYEFIGVGVAFLVLGLALILRSPNENGGVDE
jgi:hypothetical protein